jgi:predicted ATPase
MEYARNTEEKLEGAQRRLWLNRLEVEHDNLRSALGWALESNPESALQMVCSLSVFWQSHDYLTEGCNWCQAAITRAEESSPDRDKIDQTRAQAYTALAM